MKPLAARFGASDAVVSLQARWRGLSRRERWLLGIGGAVLAAALVDLLLVSPALRGIERLEAALPQQRQQLATLEALAAEARRLSSAAAPSAAAGALRPETERSLAAAGLAGAAGQWSTEDGAVEFRLTGVPARAVLDWAAAVTPALRARIVRLTLEREAAGPRVTASVRLERDTR